MLRVRRPSPLPCLFSPSPSPSTLPLMPDPSSRIDQFNAKTTSVNYPWPKEVTGIERIVLAAQGDLQRVLSAFFATPVVVSLIYSQTSRQSSPSCLPEIVYQPTPLLIASASPTSPITQTRQVHLQCTGKTVCIATSTVRISSPEVAHLFLQEKYAIGQMFRRMGKVPAFDLVAVGLGDVTEKESDEKDDKTKQAQLWRKYTLNIPDFECEILEVFLDRQMFVDGKRWLDETTAANMVPELFRQPDNANKAVYQGIKLTVVAAMLLMASFELWKVFWQSRCAAAGLR